MIGISGAPVMEIIGMGSVVTGVLVTPPALDHVSSLRTCIGEVSRLRYTLAHENAHLVILDNRSFNRTGSTAFIEIFPVLQAARSAADDWWRSLPQPGAAAACTVPLLQGQNIRYGFSGLRGPFILLTFHEDALPPDNKAAFLHLLGSILAALCLMLVLVLAAFTRHLDVLIFLLVMLAACLRYGRREEPDDHAFLPTRQYQWSLGSCSPG